MGKVIDLKEERRKEKLKNLFMKLIFVIVGIYVIYAIYLLVKTPSETMTVETGVLTEEETAIGVIIREETVVKGNNYKNGIYQILKEGEKAAKNQTIFRYYAKAEDELQAKIEEINTKIKQSLEKEKTSIFSADVKRLEEQIDEKVMEISNETDLQKILEYKKNISDIILKKAMILRRIKSKWFIY